MPRIIDYTPVTEASDDDVLLIDGLQGTRIITVGDLASLIQHSLDEKLVSNKETDDV